MAATTIAIFLCKDCTTASTASLLWEVAIMSQWRHWAGRPVRPHTAQFWQKIRLLNSRFIPRFCFTFENVKYHISAQHTEYWTTPRTWKINKYFDGSLTRARLGRQDGGLMNPPAWGNYHFKTIKLSVRWNTPRYINYNKYTNLSDHCYW